MSDDGETAVVVIALLGNPFSPSYARARERGSTSALDFCSMNVAVYSKRASAWTLAERVVATSDRTASSLAIGRSELRWENDRLVIDIDERTTPFGRRLKGRIVVHPEALTGIELGLDGSNLHRWWPVAPLARVEVDLPSPGVRFSGHGYLDANAGDVPLESTFANWSWSRARTSTGAVLTYDLDCTSGAPRFHAFKVSPHGDVSDLAHLHTSALPRSKWGLERRARSDSGARPRVVRSLEDGPFYSRALIETKLEGQSVVAVHEALAAQRLRRDWVRFCTAFRMFKMPQFLG